MESYWFDFCIFLQAYFYFSASHVALGDFLGIFAPIKYVYVCVCVMLTYLPHKLWIIFA